MFETLGGELRTGGGRRARRRPVHVTSEDRAPEPVTVTRVTVIPGTPLGDTDAARQWLASCADVSTASAEVDAALRLMNRAIQAHRVSSGDPYACDVTRRQARRIRLGYGSGDELVDGRWRDAVALAPEAEHARRRRMLAPEEQVAAILGGRRVVHPSEDLLLRARLDLDQGRTCEAALQARAAHVALLAELDSDRSGDQGAGTALRAHSELLDGLAAAALGRPLDDQQAAALDEAVTQLERFARRRRHARGEGS